MPSKNSTRGPKSPSLWRRFLLRLLRKNARLGFKICRMSSRLGLVSNTNITNLNDPSHPLLAVLADIIRCASEPGPSPKEKEAEEGLGFIQDVGEHKRPEEREREEEQVIRDFVRRLIQRKCPNCSGDVKGTDPSVIFDHAYGILLPNKDFISLSLLLQLHDDQKTRFTCPKFMCGTVFRPCCLSWNPSHGPIIPYDPASSSWTRVEEWCCDASRLFHIFSLLCGPHAHPENQLASIYQDSQINNKPVKPPAATVSGSTKAPGQNGTGYSRFSFFSRRPKSAWRPPNLLEKATSLAALPDVLTELTRVWPKKERNSQFDQDPPKILLAMICRSPLIIKMTELLREDCIETMVEHAMLYNALFKFVNVLANHPLSASIVYETRPVYPLAKTLLPLAFGGVGSGPFKAREAGSDVKGKGKAIMRPSHQSSNIDHVKPLASSFAALEFQAQAATKYRQVSGENSKDMLAMCHQICRLAEQHRLAETAASSSSSEAPRNPRSARQQKNDELRKWLSDNKVAEIEGQGWLSEYRFRDELKATEALTPPRGRMKRLLRELSILRASLPEGIFVRYDGDRLDAMKVMITGPADTPYENGLFEFDLFCDAKFPGGPPQVRFKTTPLDRRINPNLYVNGVVCLSLLGTWQGEAWIPEKSTLLQVLVSIQAMVFCPQPWFNEPGRDRVHVSPERLAQYNTDVRADTVHVGMAQWLEKLGSGWLDNTVWSEVVRKHFELTWRDILPVITDWEVASASTGAISRKRFWHGIAAVKLACSKWADTGDAEDARLMS